LTRFTLNTQIGKPNLMPNAKQVRQIFIKARVAGSKEFERLARQIGTINKSTKSLSTGFNQLRGVFAAGFFGIGLREITQALDSFQLLEDRIKVFTGSAQSASVVFEQLGNAAAFTATSTESLAQSYNRVALATTELGLSQEEILATTALLQQTFRISGSTTAEATSSTIQLAQGLSSGALRGQELRSVLEQNAVFANLLSKELNITRGQLIKFAESGQITSDRVLNALFNNFESINKQAGGLSLTIGQAFTIALDKAKFALRDLNKEFNITKTVVAGIAFVTENFIEILAPLGAALGILAFPRIVAGLKALGAILFSIKAVIALVVGGVVALAVTWETSGRRIKIVLNDISIAIAEFRLSLNSFINNTANGFFKLIGVGIKVKESLAVPAIKKEIETLNKENKKLSNEIAKINKEAEKNSFENFLKKITEGFNKKGIVAQGTGVFAQLNAEFGRGLDLIQRYRQRLDELKLTEINAQFAAGKITLLQYIEEFVKLNSEVEKLGAFEQVLTGLRLGLNDTFNGLGNILTNVRDATNRTFAQLENQILNFVKTGKFAFADFAQFVLDEITKIIIRLSIIQPLTGAIQSAFVGGGGPQTITPGSTADFTTLNTRQAAKGAVVNSSNILPFANGGIVNGPTLFPLNGQRTGLMGEAGPEAIVPLERGANGKLGVNASGASGGVVVNVNNFTDSQVDVRESVNQNNEREIEVIINRSVAKGIGEGRFDRQFQQNYGLTRRGG
jgi:lambda family phage tail tape measure protein